MKWWRWGGRPRGGTDSGGPTISARRAKVLILGATGVGKTTLFHRLLDQRPPDAYKPSTSVDIGAKMIKLEGHGHSVIELWDVPHTVYGGHALIDSYFRGADAAIIVYDQSSEDTARASWETARAYAELCGQPNRAIPVLVVANKLDITVPGAAFPRAVDTDDWKATGQRVHGPLEVSALRQVRTLEVLKRVIADVLRRPEPLDGADHLH